MNTDSQAEQIWQYAMRTVPANSGTNNANHGTPDALHDPSGGSKAGMTTVTDLSDEFDPIPDTAEFHGLAAFQSPSQAMWLLDKKVDDSTESQKENMHREILAGAQSPHLSPAITNSNPHPIDTMNTSAKKTLGAMHPAPSSHVTHHVTSAPLSPARGPATAIPTVHINDSVPPQSASVQLNKGKELATPLKRQIRAVSFRSPPAPPSPHKVSRSKTMPARRNRYAHRNIIPTSPDSFAGSPSPPDLNTFAQSSALLTNTYIRRDGGRTSVFQRPINEPSVSSSEPPPSNDLRDPSQEELHEDVPSPSQLVQAAFSPRLSPQRGVDPVVLVKDSQSDQPSQGSGRSGAGLHHQSQHSQEHSSSSASFHLFKPENLIPTQPNTQSGSGTEPDLELVATQLQPTQSAELLLSNVLPSSNVNPSGPSPVPIPPYRRRQMALLEAARLRAKDEVIPETPQSVSAPSAQPQPSVVPPRYSKSISGVIEPASVQIQRNEALDRPPRAGDVHRGGENEGQPIVQDDPAMQARATRPDAPPQPLERKGRAPRESEIIPDSQEEENRQGEQQPGGLQPSAGCGSEVVPDSQESQADLPPSTVSPTRAPAPPSSPAVPLREIFSRQNPPTPTPAAVKSPLRRGQLPKNVTHTRGRSHASTAKGKGKGKAVQSEGESEQRRAVEVDARNEEMDVDEVTSPESSGVPVSVDAFKGKRMVTASSNRKEKKTAVPKSQKTYGKKQSSRAIMGEVPAAGPSTRSRKRKDNTPARSEEFPPAVPSRPKKRMRKGETSELTPVPDSQLQYIRVFARRSDKGNYYLPGTAVFSPGDPSPSAFCRVVFDDGREDDVDVQFIRQFDLQPSDIVQITGHGKNCEAEVLGVEEWNLHELVEVQELGCGPDAPDYTTEGRFLSISEAWILEQWNERRVSFGTFRADHAFDIPEANQRLQKIGFVITLPDLPKAKRGLADIIEASGGIVYEDWTELFSFNGKAETAGKRMTGRASEITALPKNMPNQLFCLTDEPRTTPKYLIALALGVPCLSLEWVLLRVREEEVTVDWPAYVLPAGHNPVTRMPASQAFDRAWWQEAGKVEKLISQPPVLKPFSQRSFLCVGNKEFLFSSKGQLGTFPMILLAMGADYVEAVTEISRAKKRNIEFDYTVVDDGELPARFGNALSVDVSWIKKCLVTGTEGPVPWPDRI